VEVSVTDSGPGIPDSELERVFEMFHRLDSRDSREVYGHGLGLHMARRFMQAMGGEIRAEAGPAGAGASFRFWLPKAEASKA
jgi:signal transduction histidine kinase